MDVSQYFSRVCVGDIWTHCIGRDSSSRHDLRSLRRDPLNATHYTLRCLVAAWCTVRARSAVRVRRTLTSPRQL